MLNATSTNLTGNIALVTGPSGGNAVAHCCATQAAVISHVQSAMSARAAVFLASDQSAYMTAQTIGVDGGNVLR